MDEAAVKHAQRQRSGPAGPATTWHVIAHHAQHAQHMPERQVLHGLQAPRKGARLPGRPVGLCAPRQLQGICDRLQTSRSADRVGSGTA